MSYVKLHKVVSDFAVGVQSVNQALENNRSIFSQLDYKHSLGAGGLAAGDPFLGHGKHDDLMVARTVADFTIDTSTTTPRAYPLVSGLLVFEEPEFIDAGTWRVWITTPRLFGAVAQVKATGTADRYACARVYMSASGPFVVVSTWNIAGAAKENFDFSLVLWTRSVA